MRIAIISDLHANAEALSALTGSYDELWCLGDIVGYGPDVREAVDFVRDNAAIAIRGNHDNAAVSDDPIGCSPANEPLALATRDYTRRLLDSERAAFLRTLAPATAVERAGARFFLAHGSPRDPLYEYVYPTTSPAALEAMLEGTDADFVMLGHTHWPMVKQVGHCLVLNPCSLGQPRDGDRRASYAIWEDGEVTIRRCSYDYEGQLQKLDVLPLAENLRTQLRQLMTDAQVPESSAPAGK